MFFKQGSLGVGADLCFTFAFTVQSYHGWRLLSSVREGKMGVNDAKRRMTYQITAQRICVVMLCGCDVVQSEVVSAVAGVMREVQRCLGV